jgi:hypothetical protein
MRHVESLARKAELDSLLGLVQARLLCMVSTDYLLLDSKSREEDF